METTIRAYEIGKVERNAIHAAKYKIMEMSY